MNLGGEDKHSAHSYAKSFIYGPLEVLAGSLVQEPCRKQRKPQSQELSLLWKRCSVLQLEQMVLWTRNLEYLYHRTRGDLGQTGDPLVFSDLRFLSSIYQWYICGCQIWSASMKFGWCNIQYSLTTLYTFLDGSLKRRLLEPKPGKMGYFLGLHHLGHLLPFQLGKKRQ